MDSKFLNALVVEQVDDDDWRLVRPLVYYSASLDRVIAVPDGFVTDFASVPRLPFIYWYTGGKAEAPAVIHDWLYRSGTQDVTREQADAVLAEAMESQGFWKFRSWMMWAGVRLGGHWAYQKRSKHSTTFK